MDIKIYVNSSDDETSAVVHRDIMRYDIDESTKELNLILKNRQKMNISLDAVDRVLVIKPCCIWHKNKGSLITNKDHKGDYKKNHHYNPKPETRELERPGHH